MRATIQTSASARTHAFGKDTKRWSGIRLWGVDVKAVVVAKDAAKVRSLPVIHRETLAMIADGEKVTPLAARSAVYALLGAASTRRGQAAERRVLVEQAQVLAEWVEDAASRVDNG